jgi:glutaconate CoA-transferase subunit B
VTLEQVRSEVGWPLKIATDLKTTEPPTADELHLIRNELDPNGAYTRK